MKPLSQGEEKSRSNHISEMMKSYYESNANNCFIPPEKTPRNGLKIMANLTKH